MARKWSLRVALLLLVAGAGALTARAQDTRFLEAFALGDNRGQSLSLLTPGTEAAYYYRCLLLQQEGKLDEADKVLAAWAESAPGSGGRRVMENRQLLLRCAAQPGEHLARLATHLGLSLADAPDEAGSAATNLPTELDETLFAPDRHTARLLSASSGLGDFEDTALERLPPDGLNTLQLRELLQRIRRPDYPGLVKLVARELQTQGSQGFGACPVHLLLLPEQLDELAGLLPALRQHERWVRTRLARLQPGHDSDWRHDGAETAAYLDRLWAFAQGLDPKFNSLKANILYHRLRHDLSRGVGDRDRFLAYLKLPRQGQHVNPKLLQSIPYAERADLNAGFAEATLLPAVGDDTGLVREYLLRFLEKETGWADFAPYLDRDFLAASCAEAKLTAGAPDPDGRDWTGLVADAAFYDNLRRRVDIDFSPANPAWFNPDDPVSLELYIKNVKTLWVKVYVVNTLNYGKDQRQDVDAAVNLDGLTPNLSYSWTYEDGPFRRVARRFDFPELRKPGVYVVEFIGNGKSSRAVVRKRRLRFTERCGAAGHVFTIMDEAGRKVTDAAVVLGGHEFRPDAGGEVVVPYGSQARQETVLLRRWDFATPASFLLRTEEYALDAGFYVDRESLLPRQKATLLVRARLTVNGAPVPLAALEKPRLVITSVDGHGVASTREIAPLKLAADRETAVDFTVPPGLARLSCRLEGEVKYLSRPGEAHLSGEAVFPLNGDDASGRLAAFFLERTREGYALHLRGKTGEPRRSQAVELAVKCKGFRDVRTVILRTGEDGRVRLGPLAFAEWVTARSGDVSGHWTLDGDWASLPPVLHGKAGETLRVPYCGKAAAPARESFSLLERGGAGYLRDRFDALALRDGVLELTSLPAGDYSLFLKERGLEIPVSLAAGETAGSAVSSAERTLECDLAPVLQVAAVEAGASDVVIRLAGAGPETRVHLFAGRFVPEYPVARSLGSPPPPALRRWPGGAADSNYLEGRDIGDEYRYILDRQAARKYPGLMLPRPGLLLVPWSVGKAETETDAGEAGGVYAAAPAPAGPGSGGGIGGGLGSQGYWGGGDVKASPNLDFLPAPAVVRTNLRPDAQGVVRIPRAELGDAQLLRVLAVDRQRAALRTEPLERTELKPRDLRLSSPLAPDRRFAMVKEVTALVGAAPLRIDDARGAAVETAPTVGSLYRIFCAASGDATLAGDFSFLPGWGALPRERQCALYSRYACHELNFFLSRKDPAFFREVVKPFLANKLHKTFLDAWLLAGDLSAWAAPSAWARLNTVERILLAQRQPALAEAVRREARELAELAPPDPARRDRLFETALQGGALAGDTPAHNARRLLELTPGISPMKKQEQRADAGEDNEEDRPAEIQEVVTITDEAPQVETTSSTVGGVLADKLEMARRRGHEAFYRAPEKTEILAETAYYHQGNSATIPGSPFWEEYARWDGKGPFLSPRVLDAVGEFSGMMFALAVTDLPLDAVPPETAPEGDALTVRSASPALVFCKRTRESAAAADALPVMVAQNVFRQDDRTRRVGGRVVDKFVTGDLAVFTPYGCRVVVSNPTPAPRRLELLLQIPEGAMPLSGGAFTRSVAVDLGAYQSSSLEYFFYFPGPGQFRHYPFSVTENGQLVAAAPAAGALAVTDRPPAPDPDSWPDVARRASTDEMLAYLERHNLREPGLDLARAAWRMQAADCFRRTLDLLRRNHLFSAALWQYALKHGDTEALREYLASTRLAGQCGTSFDSPLLKVDPVESGRYRHLEFDPLVNARAHPFGAAGRLPTPRVQEQFAAFLDKVAHQTRPTDADRLEAAYYLLLQDRVDDAKRQAAAVRPGSVDTRLQLDYLNTCLAFCDLDLVAARRIAALYANYPVDRWRERFQEALRQLDEAAGAGPAPSRATAARETADRPAGEPSFDFTVEGRKILLTYQNLAEVSVQYYPVDIELLFSVNPFVRDKVQSAYTQARRWDNLRLPPGGSFSWTVPEELGNANLLVEVSSGALRKAAGCTANALAVQVAENFGQVKVTRQGSALPVPRAYVKVYARMQDRSVVFYKDGYTDLRGRFDYASLSSDELDRVERFAILVLSESDGAEIREAAPPKR